MFSSELFSFQGRASRSKFWLVFLLSIFVSFVVVLFSILAIPALIFMGTFSPTVAAIVSILLYVLMIPMWWISIATSVKRFHDRNKSGWWYLIVLVPFLGALWLIIENGFLSGTAGANNYGNDPLLPGVLGVSTATPQFTGATSIATPISTGPSTGMLIVYIVGGIFLIALLGRLGWAFWQVQNDKASVAQISTTKTEDINPGTLINSEVKSDTFTTAQLTNLKNDLTALYLKYQDRTEAEKNTEPLRGQVYQELDTIFLKDLGVVTKITANDFGSGAILLQPEVANIIAEIETQYGKPKNVPVAVVPTSKIVISNLNYSSVPISDLSKYATKALTFNVTNVALAKELCTVTYWTYLGDPKNNHPLNRPHTLCNPYYSNSKSGYSDSVYFSNLASSYSGGYDETSRNYFEIEGIDNTIVEFYLKDTSGKESNRLKLTITGDTKKVSAQSTVQSPVSTTNVSTASPTAKYTVNGGTNINVKVGDRISSAWRSTNADSFLTTIAMSGCSDSTRNEKGEKEDTASGEESDIIIEDYLGCTIYVTYSAKNLVTGKQATATAIIKVSSVLPTAATTAITPVNKCSKITMTNAQSTVPARQSIDFPAQGATLIAGQTYTTSWLDEKYNSPASYPVYLSTAPKNDPLNELGAAYKAQCSFTFTIPSSATPGSNYRLMFSRNGMTSIYSNVFTISK